MISVVIPYRASRARGDELLYAVRSWCKYSRFDFDVWILGDKPDWYSGRHIRTKRGLKRFFDVIEKLDTAAKTSSITDRFVYTYDDIYLIDDLDMGLLEKAVSLGIMSPVKEPQNRWETYRNNTLALLSTERESIYDYETHLPTVFDKARVRFILDKYNFKDEGILFSTLYYNNFAAHPDLILSRKTNFRAKVNVCSEIEISMDDLLQVCSGKKVMNHTDEAYDSPSLRQYLQEKFPEKCRYEY